MKEQNKIDSLYDEFVLISVAWPGLRTLILLMKNDKKIRALNKHNLKVLNKKRECKIIFLFLINIIIFLEKIEMRLLKLLSSFVRHILNSLKLNIKHEISNLNLIITIWDILTDLPQILAKEIN